MHVNHHRGGGCIQNSWVQFLWCSSVLEISTSLWSCHADSQRLTILLLLDQNQLWHLLGLSGTVFTAFNHIYVGVGECSSTTHGIKYGVSQGSILGPVQRHWTAASASTVMLMIHSCASSCLLRHSVNRLLFSCIPIIKSSQPDMLTFLEASWMFSLQSQKYFCVLWINCWASRVNMHIINECMH